MDRGAAGAGGAALATRRRAAASAAMVACAGDDGGAPAAAKTFCHGERRPRGTTGAPAPRRLPSLPRTPAGPRPGFRARDLDLPVDELRLIAARNSVCLSVLALAGHRRFCVHAAGPEGYFGLLELLPVLLGLGRGARNHIEHTSRKFCWRGLLVLSGATVSC